MHHFYFAYGSNMNPDRVIGRKMKFRDHFAATLHDFRLAFNKRSVLFPGAASANVIRADGAHVEGVAYHLEQPDEIEVMDPFEGYPELYIREPHEIWRRGESVLAWVYVATPNYVTEGLKPNRWYLNHLLKGQPYLSPHYYEGLSGTECLPDSDIEPI